MSNHGLQPAFPDQTRAILVSVELIVSLAYVLGSKNREGTFFRIGKLSAVKSQHHGVSSTTARTIVKLSFH